MKYMSNQFITDYKFGKIKIDGQNYSNDIILLGTEVRSDWWRERGHLLSKKDLKDVTDYNPDILMVGTGRYGRMTVPKTLSRKLDMEVKSYKTAQAIEKYNNLLTTDKKVAAGFHLTC